MRRFALNVLSISLLCAGCGADGSGVPLDASAADTAADVASSAPGAQVCARWNAERAFIAEGAWSGSAATCDAGTLERAGVQNTLHQVNLFRWMAKLPPVTVDAAKNDAAQACALAMHANDVIEHDLPSSWDCVTPAAQQAAKLSNLATAPAVDAMGLYIVDGGVPNLGHRRWILSNSLGPIGVGSTNAYSCLHVINGDGAAGARWTAWPPPGDFPIQAAQFHPWESLDSAGWSIQSDALDLTPAVVTVTRGGQPLAMDVDTRLDTGYGSTFGIRMVPRGWSLQVGGVYHVQVRGLLEDIDYDIRVVDCDAR